jgi:hypothetical protein
VKRGKKVFEFENLSDIGRSEKCHMFTFLQTDSFLYNWLEPFCCLAQFKKCLLHSQNANMAQMARIWLGLQKFSSVTNFIDHKYPCFCHRATY